MNDTALSQPEKPVEVSPLEKVLQILQQQQQQKPVEISQQAKLLAQRIIAGQHPDISWKPKEKNEVTLTLDISGKVDGVPAAEVAEAVKQQIIRPYDRFKKKPNDPTIHYITHEVDGKLTVTLTDSYKAFLDKQITAQAALGGS